MASHASGALDPEHNRSKKLVGFSWARQLEPGAHHGTQSSEGGNYRDPNHKLDGGRPRAAPFARRNHESIQAWIICPPRLQPLRVWITSVRGSPVNAFCDMRRGRLRNGARQRTNHKAVRTFPAIIHVHNQLTGLSSQSPPARIHALVNYVPVCAPSIHLSTTKQSPNAQTCTEEYKAPAPATAPQPLLRSATASPADAGWADEVMVFLTRQVRWSTTPRSRLMQTRNFGSSAKPTRNLESTVKQNRNVWST